MTDWHADEGFSLIELLLVVVILAIVTTVVVMSVGGFSAEAEDAAGESDRQHLETASETYLAQPGVAAIPDAGGPEGYEQTLVDGELLRSTSQYYDLDAAGQLVQVAGSACTV
jgi:prepilin-type N-terminal cleavage/methylation domain-containing protein